MTQSEISLVVGPSLTRDLPSNLAKALDEVIELYPGATLTTVSASGLTKVISYSELRSLARMRWSEIRAQGVRPGDRLIILGREPYDILEFAWACFLGGATAVPIIAPLDLIHDEAGRKRIGDALTVVSDARILIPGNSKIDTNTLEEIAQRDVAFIFPSTSPLVAGNDFSESFCPKTEAMLLLTSGSTGLPKAVRLTHGQIVRRSVSTVIATPVLAEQVALNWMPLDHVGGIVMFHITPLIAGCSQVQVATSYISADPLRWLDLIDRFRAGYFWAPNFAFGRVVERLKRKSPAPQWDLSCVKTIINGGEAVNANTARTFLKMLEPTGLEPSSMRPMWGMSETASGCILASELRDDLHGGTVSVGRPLPGISMRLVDDDGHTVNAGSVGVLQVRGEFVTDRYAVANDDANAAFLEDGWFSTGDEGIIVEGQLSLIGRSSETLVVNGVNHHPPALEMALEKLQWVRPGHVAVCGIRRPGDDTDEAFVFISPKDGERLTDGRVEEVKITLMRQFGVRARKVVQVDPTDIPRTSLGKIQRKLLMASYKSTTIDDQASLKNAIFSPLLLPTWQAIKRDREVLQIKRRWQIINHTDRLLRTRLGSRYLEDLSDYIKHDRSSACNVTLDSPTGSIMLMDGTVDSADLAADIQSDRDLLALAIKHNQDVIFKIVVLLNEGSSNSILATPSVESRVAFLRSVATEVPGLTVSVIYNRESPNNDESNLYQEVTLYQQPESLISGDTVLYRRYSGIRVVDETHTSSPLIHGGNYIITGSGEVSALLAGILIDQYGAQVTVLGRQQAPTSEIPVRCNYVRCDVTAPFQIKKVIAEVSSHRDIDAVFHLAGMATELPFNELTAATIKAEISAKVDGIGTIAECLYTLSSGAILVSFSSILASFFAPLYSAYAAANRYMEAYSQQDPSRFRCISWGMIDGMGMSRGKLHGEHASNLGFGRINRSEFLSGLIQTLDISSAVTLVGVNPAGSKVLGLADTGSSDKLLGITLTSNFSVTTGTTDSAAINYDLTANELALLPDIINAWKELLGVADVKLGDNFFSLGGDSLGLAELHARLCEISHTELPMVPLFTADNLADVVRYAAGNYDA